jgi:putative SOS response-associated peptidase YedK
MIPYFAKSLDQFKDLSTINAKADTLLDRPTWREAFRRRRCLVPADGLYEWQLPGKAIEPYETPAVETSLFPGQVELYRSREHRFVIERPFW